MSDYIWVGCGDATSRVELLGLVEETFTNSDANTLPLASHHLASISSIRVCNLQPPSTAPQDNVIVEIEIEEIFLDDPIPLSAATLTENTPYAIQSIPEGRLVLEGLEQAQARLLDTVTLAGWKLVLETLSPGVMHAAWYLVGDWGFDTHPDYFPGSSFGEVSFVSDFGGQTNQRALRVDIPWPFAQDAHLTLGIPKRQAAGWICDIVGTEITSIFDPAGPAFKEFLLGKINVASFNTFRLETGLDEEGHPVFHVRATISGPLTISRFGTHDLKVGGGELRLSGIIGATHVDFTAELALGSGTTLDLTGPVVIKKDAAPTTIRQVLPLIPPNNGSIKIPTIRTSLTAPSGSVMRLASASIPLRWDTVPATKPTTASLFDGLVLKEIDASSLVGYSFGSLSSDAPQIQFRITSVTQAAAALVLGLELTVQASSGPNDRFTIRGSWRFAFNISNLSFTPGKSIELEGVEFRATGVVLSGLKSLGVSWEGESLALTATGLRAYFDRISDLSDPSDHSRGFEFDVPFLRVDSGGLDLQLKMAGGVTKLGGIGEAFKGTRGEVTILDSKLQSGFLTAEGPLPHLDNATGSITVTFRDGLYIDQAAAEFQLGLHRRVDWWLELDLKTVRLQIAASPDNPEKTVLILMITGGISFKPEADGLAAIAGYLKEARLDFKDLVLTKAYSGLPPGLSLLVELAKPMEITLLEAFTFQLRSVGIGPGSDAGQGAINIGGQIYFSSQDLQDVRPDYHIFKLQKPDLGSLIPRVTLDHLPVHYDDSPSIKIDGFVGLIDTPQRRGFIGAGELLIGDTIDLRVYLEFMRVERPSDRKMLRVWAVYAELLNVNIPLVANMYLRDVGVGFGWRKTISIMDDPNIYIETPSQGSRTFAPHLPTSWVDDLDGDDAHWTVVLSAWLTYDRDEVSPLVADILLGLRSDFTFFLGVRAWPFASLNGLRGSSRAARPAIVGLIYYSMRNRHLLATVITSPAAAAPEGIPPALIEALGGMPFSFVLETKPGLFRVELGWPRQLTLRLGVWTGWVGLLLRKTSSSLTIGVSFEIGLSFSAGAGLDLGIFGFSIDVYGQISVYGEILARIGSEPALFGTVGINAIISINISAWIRIKLGFFKLEFSFSFGFELILTARISFGIAGGFGLEGYASVSLKIWKFRFGGSVAIVINEGALNEARRRVYEGTTMAGLPAQVEVPVRQRPLPLPKGDLPVVPEAEQPEWAVLHVQKADKVYVLLLPARDTWFATPPPATVPPNTPPDSTEHDFPQSAIADYEFSFQLQGINLTSHLGDPAVGNNRTGAVSFQYHCNWNVEVPPLDDPENKAHLKLGDYFNEDRTVYNELRLVEAILDDFRYRPELLVDWRVRAETSAASDTGTRPDVRSPFFSADDSLYDLALEEAFGYGKHDTLSWERVALGMTRWAELSAGTPFGQLVSEMFNAPLPTDPNRHIDTIPTGEHMYAAVEQLKRNRSGLLTRLLHEFREWVIGGKDDIYGPLLAGSGLAFEFQVDPKATTPWLLDLQSLTVNRSFGVGQAIQVLSAISPKAELLNAAIRPHQGGLGFAREGLEYRVKDILEFQDSNGIHFSWQLERIDPNGVSNLMTYEELCGLAALDSDFEYFDHYEVVRVNESQLAREVGPDSPQTASQVATTSREVRPGFLPSFLDMGGGETKFYLVAPRFEFSDQFEVPARVGDLLLYRVTALDVFGNRSQTIEHLTYRKQLEPPPPPDGGRAVYQVELTTNTASEQLNLSVQPSSNLQSWSGGEVTHEIWVRTLPLFSEGYYGLGNDPIMHSDGRPTITPQGMVLVGNLPNGATELIITDLAQLGYGLVHEFHVRTISSDGNASRLIRCQHLTSIKAGGQESADRPHAFLERIPAPGADVGKWVSLEEMRSELQTTQEPVPSISTDKKVSLSSVAVTDLAQRELTLRIQHQPYVDSVGQHPTGGYVIFVRDRDATIGADPSAYKRLAEIEVISPERYRATPDQSQPWNKWHGRYLETGQAAAFQQTRATGEGVSLGWLDWGAGASYQSADALHLLPQGTYLHEGLFDLLTELKARAVLEGYEVAIHHGPPGRDELSKLTCKALLENHSPEKDPYGSGLLKVLGRSLDVTVAGPAGPAEPQRIFDWLSDSLHDLGKPRQAPDGSSLPFFKFENDQALLEIMVNGDRHSQMEFCRISLQPRIRVLPTYPLGEIPKPETLADRKSQNRQASFLGFKNALARAFAAFLSGALLPGLADMTQDSYEALTQRFLRQHALTPITPSLVGLGVAFFEDSGSFARPLNPDGTIAIQLFYKEEYARRLTYRVQRLSRYLPLYRELGLAPADLPEQTETSADLLVRLPRVKPPASPSASFLGNFLRGETMCSEWIIGEHDEDALVQSNETLRNRLGYRGIAWSLFSEVIPNWEAWSGWSGDAGWQHRRPDVTDGWLPGLSNAEKALLGSDASWAEPEGGLPQRAGLDGHPFTDLLLPKGTVIRVPRLPYYYRYRLGIFARADDLDSDIRLVDASPAIPVHVPAIDAAHAGWAVNSDDLLEVWWRIPSVWDSLEPVEQAMWANERPFASRLWDFDLRYSFQITRFKGDPLFETTIPLISVSLVPSDPAMPAPQSASYLVRSAGTELFWETQSKIETRTIGLESSFMPRLRLANTGQARLALHMTDAFRTLAGEFDFAIDLVCQRAYGRGAPSVTQLVRSADKEPVS